MATVLIVDDDSHVGSALGSFFERAGHLVLRAETGEEGIDAYMRAGPDLVLLDLQLPDLHGFDVLGRIHDQEPVVIVITGHGDVATAVRAMQLGAENFLLKPVDLEHLGAAADRALDRARLRRMHRYVRERQSSSKTASLLGSSPPMRELAHQVELLSASDRTTVLLLGESGTGKGRVAEAIHAASPRAGQLFVEVSCAGRAPDVLERELFGVSQSGGSGDRTPGMFEVADGGTLFLDEVAALGSEIQSRLLALLDGRGAGPAGVSNVPNVRVIAATCSDLVDEVNAGRFREDLYYRLSVMPVHLPPLRVRAREDVLDLIARLLGELRAQLPGAPPDLSEAALEQLLRYSWPGNVRELRNALERAMILSHGERRIGLEHLPPEVRRATDAGATPHVPMSLAEVERAHIERTLRAHGENRTRAARVLGISRATLINKIKLYGLAEQRGPRRPQGPGRPCARGTATE